MANNEVEPLNAFEHKLAEHRLTLTRASLQVLQINVGRKCNQACRHCHADAAPWRTEMMDGETAQRIGAWIMRFRPATVDLTGTQLNHGFHGLARRVYDLSSVPIRVIRGQNPAGAKVIDRNNLTIIEEQGYDDLPAYLAKHEVEVIASLPCYSKENVNRQRGNGVFEKSISALRELN